MIELRLLLGALDITRKIWEFFRSKILLCWKTHFSHCRL